MAVNSTIRHFFQKEAAGSNWNPFNWGSNAMESSAKKAMPAMVAEFKKNHLPGIVDQGMARMKKQMAPYFGMSIAAPFLANMLMNRKGGGGRSAPRNTGPQRLYNYKRF